MFHALSMEADKARAAKPGDSRPIYQIRADLEEALAAEYPAVVAAVAAVRSRCGGKKAVVAAAVAAVLDLEDPEVIESLREVARAKGWKAAGRAIARLGVGGEILRAPEARGLQLPCSPHASPTMWGTNWGLPNVVAVAEMLLRRAPAQPTSGNGWALLRA